jgi:anti-anti-sigma factor
MLAEDRAMADSTLQVGFETQGTAVVVSPQGEIGYSEATVFRTWLRKAHDAKTPRVVVDLSKVDYMNTPGVATLVESLQIAKKAKTRLILCGMNEKVFAIFKIARLDTVFEITPTAADAVAKA